MTSWRLVLLGVGSVLAATTACSGSSGSSASSGGKDSGGSVVDCYSSTGVTCSSVATADPNFTCVTPGAPNKIGACPSTGLVGCCVYDQPSTTAGYSEVIGNCYYTSPGAALGEQGCPTTGPSNATNHVWQSTAP